MNNPLAGTDPTGYIGCKVGEICTTSFEKKTEFVGKPLSRIQRRVETTTITTTNSAGNVVNVSKIAQSGNNITHSSVSKNNNGDISQVVASTHNRKTGESASAAYDFGTQESIANASPTTMSSTAPSLQAKWCYNGACRTGIMSSIDTRTIGQIDNSLRNLNSGFSALIGGVSGAGMFKALITDVAEYVTKSGIKFKRWKNSDAIDKPMPDGSAPSWNTVRSRYWKNRATASNGEFSKENIARMRQGKAPIDFNPRIGKFESRELHHVTPQRAGGSNSPLNLRELTPDQHGAVDPFRHTVPTTSGIR
ncbi:hypothetical protein N478_25895 [Pseudoalteromonas luteoviolacea S4060-1]|uniref:LHH domain-containing protein n=2 Tax=Pseudoalteromonas luteoviolacea TaxID=43657 RepID=A0A161Y275_9GAMM|nr:hypothetical protein N478_25895 [Pseudoalteromonas luteoviolacea S4060-1]